MTLKRGKIISDLASVSLLPPKPLTITRNNLLPITPGALSQMAPSG